MWSFGVVPDEVVHKVEVEIIRLIDVVEMKVDALLLDGAIEALQEAI